MARFTLVPALALTTALCACGLAGEGGSTPVTLSLAAPRANVPDPDATPAAARRTATLAVQPPMLLGVQTHFSQGWPASLLTRASDARAALLRDSLPWGAGEPEKGRYDLTGSAAAALAAACAAGQRVVLAITPQHPLYDGGKWVTSEAGNAAYAAYLAALADRFGPCLAGIELGNELNVTGGMPYPDGTDRAAAYVRTAAAVRARIGGRTAIVAGSTNMIGTGFLKPLFAAGLLAQVDAVSVHPYRLRGEGLAQELASLDAAMAAAGRRVPVWATEFSLDTPDRAYAAGELVKQATLMAGSGVALASWYALIDQRWFPEMGLYAGTAPKLQADAYRQVQALLALGRPRRIDMGDPLIFAWRFGADTTVIWGAPRAMSVTGGSVASPTGAPLPGTFTLSEAPAIVRGTTAIAAGQSAWLADTLMGWGTPQWRYFARGADGRDNALPLFDDQFTSYFGDRWYRPLRINATSAAPAGTGAAPVRAVWRYVAPAAQAADVGACLSKGANGDGVDVTIARNGKPLWTGILTAMLAPAPIRVDLAAGDRLDLVVGPNQTAGGDSFNVRMVLFRRGQASAVACPG